MRNPRYASIAPENIFKVTFVHKCEDEATHGLS